MTNGSKAWKGLNLLPKPKTSFLRRKENAATDGSHETNNGILFKPKLSTMDLAGSGAKYASVEEMKKLLDKLRDEDV